MPELTMEKPWDVQYAMNTLYRLYAEQKGLPPANVTSTRKSQEELAALCSEK